MLTTVTLQLSQDAIDRLDRLTLPGESREAAVDRVLAGIEAVQSGLDPSLAFKEILQQQKPKWKIIFETLTRKDPALRLDMAKNANLMNELDFAEHYLRKIGGYTVRIDSSGQYVYSVEDLFNIGGSIWRGLREGEI